MAPPRPRDSLAVASLVLALCGFLTLGFTGPVGAILGHVARRRIRRTGADGDGLARAGIIIGWIFTGVAVLFCGLGIAAIVLPVSTTVNR